MELVFKSVVGAVLVVAIQIFSRNSNYYLAGLVLTFPAFSLLAHYTIGIQRTTAELKETVLFGIFGIIPYFIYLVSMYLTLEKTSLIRALSFSTFSWFILAIFLIIGWSQR